jgi:hypothetical protein
MGEPMTSDAITSRKTPSKTEILSPRRRTELRDLLAGAWDAWMTASDAGPERSARLLFEGRPWMALARRTGETQASLWALLAEIRPETKAGEFDAMITHFEEWEGGRS